MNQVTRRQDNQLQRVAPRDLIQQKSKMMIEALPGNESGRKRFMQAALGVASQPSISRCEPNSVLKAIYQCARLNLIPDPVLHHVAIVPFRNKGVATATVVIEYRGLIELMKRANPSLSIKAATVYANDDYTLVEGSTDELKVTKRWWEKGKKDPGEPVLFYAVVREPGAEPVLQTVPAVEAKKIGSSSKAGMKPGTPWHDHFERMGEKTAIKRIERFVRMDPDKEETKQFREALEYDDRTDEQIDLADDTDIMGSMSGDGQDPAEDLNEGATRIGKVDNPPRSTPATSVGAKPTSNPPAAAVESSAEWSTAPSAEPPPPSSTEAPPTELKPNEPASMADKKKLAAVVDLALDYAGIKPDQTTRYALLSAASGLEDFAKGSVGATHGDMNAWREMIKGMTADDVKKYVNGEVASEPEPSAEALKTPFDKVIQAWRDKRGVDLDTARTAATKLLAFRYELDPPDLGEDEVTEQILSGIKDGSINLERYEKG